MTPNRIEFSGPGEFKIVRAWMNYRIGLSESITTEGAVYGDFEYELRISGLDHLGTSERDGYSFRGRLDMCVFNDSRYDLRVEGEYMPRGNKGWFRITDESPRRLVSSFSSGALRLMGGWRTVVLGGPTPLMPRDLRDHLVKDHLGWNRIGETRSYYIERLEPETESWTRQWEARVEEASGVPSVVYS